MQVDEEYYGQSHVCSMTPTEFEEYCLKILQGYAEDENLCDFTIDHDVKLVADDGTYQIDMCMPPSRHLAHICKFLPNVSNLAVP